MESMLQESKESILSVLEGFVDQNIIKGSELRRFIKNDYEEFDPEMLRFELEQWYINMGIENIIGRKLTLTPCPFSAEEIKDAAKNSETIICIPGNVDRVQLGELFRIKSWALHDPLVTQATEKEDFWFKTSMSLRPQYIKMSGNEICHLFEDEKKHHFSLERYLVFIGRMRYLLKQTPDHEYWIWLPRGRYDRSGMLIAGFDRFGTFNVHGWMPQFSASFLGARFILKANH